MNISLATTIDYYTVNTNQNTREFYWSSSQNFAHINPLKDGNRFLSEKENLLSAVTNFLKVFCSKSNTPEIYNKLSFTYTYN